MYRDEPSVAPLLIFVSGSRVEAVDRGHGKMVWAYTLAAANLEHRVAVRLWVGAGRVIVVSSADVPGFFSPLAPCVVTCLDYLSGRKLWEQPFDVGSSPPAFRCSILVDGGQLLIGTRNQLLAFAFDDGNPLWQRRVAAAEEAALAPAMGVPGSVVQSDR